MEIRLGPVLAGGTSLAVSYGFQRGIALVTGLSDINYLGPAVVNTTTQIASIWLSVRLIGHNENYVWAKLGLVQVAAIAGLFFSSMGCHLFIARPISINFVEKFGEAVIYALAKAVQYIADGAIKIGLLSFVGRYGESMYEYIVTAAHVRWEQLKSNVTVLRAHLAHRYEYYTFPTFTSRDEFKELSKEQLEAVHVHYALYPDKWEVYTLPMQVAFNLILAEKDLPLLPLTSPFKAEDDFTQTELKFIAKESYRNYCLSAELAIAFFHHHVKPPEYLIEKEFLPQIPIPREEDIPSLSKAQIKWFHKILISKEEYELTSEQYSAFAKRFFQYDLIPPNEKYVFDVELPLPTSRGLFMRVKAYYYYLYVMAGRDEKLNFDDRMHLRQFLIDHNFGCSLPNLSSSQLALAAEPVLSRIAKQFEKNRFLWEQLDSASQRLYNQAFRRYGINEIRDSRRFASLRDTLSCFMGNFFGMTYYPSRALMDIAASERSLGYLDAIPNERLNYLHPSMICHLPDEKIGHLTRPDLVQAIPKNKLFFIHPKVYPLLSDQQIDWMENLHMEVADLSIMQIRLLLCPWLVRHVPEDRLIEVPKQGKEFVHSPTKISVFHQAFSSLLQTPQKAWDEMTLIQQKLFDLVPFGLNRFPMIESITDFKAEFASLARFFGVRETPSDYQLRTLTTTSNLLFFADDPMIANMERKQMEYQFKHLIYMLKIMAEKDPPLDQETKATVGTLLKQLFHAMRECKNAWISALTNFEGKRNEFCNCPDCSGTRLNDKEVLLQSRLAGKLAVFKRECFQKVILKAYNFDGDRDGQQVHTLDWYARELPHLNLHSGYSDRHFGISRREVPPLEMQKRMIDEYMGSVKSYVKDLMSYGKNGDQEFRELALDFTSGIILREAQNRKAYIDSAWAKDIASSWIWDMENAYEVRDGFVNIILYAFNHFGFDPLSEVFTQTQSNRRLLSENLDLVSIKLTQLDKR